MTEELNKVIMLIGLPGSGKSTWRSQFVASNPDAVVISSDDLIEEYGKAHNQTYSEAWKNVDMKAIDKEIRDRYKKAIEENKKIVIVDRTNMSAKARAWFLKDLPKNYVKEAQVFNVSDDVLKERLAKREKEEGKAIPPFVISRMKSSFQRPTLEEFDIIKLAK